MSTNGDFSRFQGTPGYIASGPLVDAVNCAIALERPLLLKGEPGTGKTVLARHVAEGLGMPMLSWHIKSISKAGDGLYVPVDQADRANLVNVVPCGNQALEIGTQSRDRG